MGWKLLTGLFNFTISDGFKHYRGYDHSTGKGYVIRETHRENYNDLPQFWLYETTNDYYVPPP